MDKSEIEHKDLDIDVNRNNVALQDLSKGDIELDYAKEASRVKDVKNAELYAAIQNTHIPRWSKESCQLYMAILCATMCCVANGYDGSLMTAILAMPHFQETFESGKTGGLVSVIFSMYTVGSMSMAPVAAVVSDRYGRRWTMASGAVVIILGMIIASTARAIPQFAAGRFVLGAGVAIMIVAAPAYVMEWRGRSTALYHWGYYLGSIPAGIVTFGCNYIDNNLSWQLPLIFQAFACLVVLCLVPFIPESPRFHMANGHDDKALAFLTTYHGNNDPNAALVVFQFHEMKEGIKTDGVDKRWWDYRPFVFSHSGRWRFAQILMIGIFGQFSGNGLGYFNTVIYENLGVTNVNLQLAYNLISSIASAIVCMVATLLCDKMPRRMVTTWGTFVMGSLLGINGGLSALLDKQIKAGEVGKSTAEGALAAYILFGCAYSFTYSPLQAVIPAEALETTTRAKGLAAYGFIGSGISFINQFAGPYALASLGYKYIFIFVAWDMFEVLMWYLFCVESCGRSLEELAWVYDQPNPVKASKTVEKVVIGQDGAVVEAVHQA